MHALASYKSVSQYTKIENLSHSFIVLPFVSGPGNVSGLPITYAA